MENNRKIIELGIEEISAKLKEANNTSEAIDKVEQLIETSKKEIVAFKENIDSYKNDVA